MSDAAVPTALLECLAQVVEAELGLSYPSARWEELGQKVAAAARRAGSETLPYAKGLLARTASAQEIRCLILELTVSETFFLRDAEALGALEVEVLEPLLARRRGREQRLSIWSAGCCSGEEPYSLAMILDRLLPSQEGWEIDILGTDLNSESLAKAEAALYSEWSFRGTPEWLKERYFQRTPAGRYQLSERIRTRVRFAQHNLVAESYPRPARGRSGFDLVLCRNVLMYLSPEVIERTAQRFHESLAEEGWLLLSASEASCAGLSPPFEPVHVRGRTFFRKGSATLPAAAPAAERRRSAPPPPRVSPPAPAPAPQRTSVLQPLALGAAPFDAAQRAYARGRFREVVDGLLGSPQSAKSSAACALLARAHANLGLLREATEWCTRAVGLDDLSAPYRYLQASIAQEQGDLASAEAALNQALYLDEGFIPAHLSLGNLLRAQGRSEAAHRHYRNAREGLAALAPEAPLREADGLTAGELLEAVEALLKKTE